MCRKSAAIGISRGVLCPYTDAFFTAYREQATSLWDFSQRKILVLLLIFIKKKKKEKKVKISHVVDLSKAPEQGKD